MTFSELNYLTTHLKVVDAVATIALLQLIADDLQPLHRDQGLGHLCMVFYCIVLYCIVWYGMVISAI